MISGRNDRPVTLRCEKITTVAADCSPSLSAGAYGGNGWFMMKLPTMLVSAFALVLTAGAPAVAVDNPLVVDLHAMKGAQRAASATLFGKGSSVLVNVTANGALPKDAAVTLNDGDCAKPGDIAFALSGLADSASLTQLDHPLSEVAGKAKSLVIHQTSSQTSPPFACGPVSG
jgi:hypothetical protein